MKQEKEKKLNETFFFFKINDHTLIECFSLHIKYKKPNINIVEIL